MFNKSWDISYPWSAFKNSTYIFYAKKVILSPTKKNKNKRMAH